MSLCPVSFFILYPKGLRSQYIAVFWEHLLGVFINKLILINFAVNILFIIGKGLQYLFLGPLREMEVMKLGSRLRCVLHPQSFVFR